MTAVYTACVTCVRAGHWPPEESGMVSLGEGEVGEVVVEVH